ncbi:MAG TPA: DUF4170 domain-containing protein [Alphaproteobacteria bacterium]|nr:DUF4170 domain-containing protein [Alphaproteobacteria bacterium]
MPKQLLHLVFGGRLKDPKEREFEDLNKLDIVGIFPNYAEAYNAWRGKAQATIDDAEVRYFIVHIHRLFDPDEEDHPDGHHERQ